MPPFFYITYDFCGTDMPKPDITTPTPDVKTPKPENNPDTGDFKVALIFYSINCFRKCGFVFRYNKET